MNRKYTNRCIRKEEVIDLTDTSGNNHTPVIRELEQDPVTGCVTVRAAIDPPKNKYLEGQVIPEDRGLAYSKPQEPEDPEGNCEEQLEAEGATTTFFPASNTRITKRSQAPEERAEQRMFEYYNK
jgi:hypothetical protein